MCFFYLDMCLLHWQFVWDHCQKIKLLAINCFPEGSGWWIKNVLYFSAIIIPSIKIPQHYWLKCSPQKWHRWRKHLTVVPVSLWSLFILGMNLKFHIWIHHSIRHKIRKSVITDFQSSSSIVWHTSAFSSQFPSIEIISANRWINWKVRCIFCILCQLIFRYFWPAGDSF